MATQPCMWPASANTWPVPAACWRGGRSQAEDHPTPWTFSFKTGKVCGGSGVEQDGSFRALEERTGGEGGAQLAC